MQRILDLLIGPIIRTREWMRAPHNSLLASASMAVLLTPVIAGTAVASVDRSIITGNATSNAYLLFAAFSVVSLAGAALQFWVSSRVLGGIPIATWENAHELASLRQRVAVLNLPTMALVGVGMVNVAVLPIVMAGAVAWIVVCIALVFLWVFGTVVTLGALDNMVDRASVESLLWSVFDVLTVPRHFFALEQMALSAIGPAPCAIFLLLTAVLGPTTMALALLPERDLLRRLSTNDTPQYA